MALMRKLVSFALPFFFTCCCQVFELGVAESQSTPKTKLVRSRAIVYLSTDLQGFLNSLAQTQAGEEFEKSNFARITFSYLKIIEGKLNAGGGSEIPTSESELLVWLSKLCDGQLKAILFSENDQLTYVAEVRLSPTNTVIAKILNGMHENGPFRDWQFEKVNNESGLRLRNRSLGLFLRFQKDVLTISNNEDYVIDDLEVDERPVSKELFDSRKFLTVSSQSKFRKERDSDCFVYVDLDAVARFAISKSQMSEETKATLAEIGINEMLAFGGVFGFGSADRREGVEFAADFVLIQGVPKVGINKLFRLGSLKNPVGDNVPADVDFCFSTQLDLTELISSANKLDEVLFGTFSLEHPVREGIADFVPLLGMALWHTPEEVRSYTGRFDFFGSVSDSKNISEVNSVSRLMVSRHNGSQLMSALADRIPGMEVMEKHDFEQGSYWMSSMSDHKNMIEQLRSRSGIEFSKERQAFVGSENFVAVLSHESQLDNILAVPRDLLKDDETVTTVWEYLTIQGRHECGGFLFLRGSHMLRPFYPFLRAYKPIVAEEDIKHSESNDETLLTSRKRDLLECGGLSICETPNGLVLSFVTLRAVK